MTTTPNPRDILLVADRAEAEMYPEFPADRVFQVGESRAVPSFRVAHFTAAAMEAGSHQYWTDLSGKCWVMNINGGGHLTPIGTFPDHVKKSMLIAKIMLIQQSWKREN